jgi:primary-amine oxidase
VTEVETRATGIVSVVNIDPDKTSDYGNVVSPGALAQNHQHIFAVRIDPAIDGHKNTVVAEESHRVPINDVTNLAGNFYENRQSVISRAGWLDAAPQHNRIIKIQNRNVFNPVSGKFVGYKFIPALIQLLFADSELVQSKRALFAQHHVWVTKYKDGELYAGGRYTLQSQREIGGVADVVRRGEEVADEDIVV